MEKQTIDWWSRWALMFRLLFLVVVFAGFMVGKPPATASIDQSRFDSGHTDVQDERIAQVDTRVKEHERLDDARVERLQTAFNAQAVQMGEMRGEQRGIFGALAILQVLAMLFQFKKEKGR